MKPRVLRAKKNQTYFLPSAADEVWEPLFMGHRVHTRFRLMLEVLDPPVTPIGCLVMARIGRNSGLGVTASRLARELTVPRATLRHHLDTLTRHYLIERWLTAIHDKRKRRIVLTERGARVLNEAAALFVDLTAGGPWPDGAPRRHWWHLRRLPADSPLEGGIVGDPYPGVSRKTPVVPQKPRR